jgi:Protein of unknown function (DUF4232)
MWRRAAAVIAAGAILAAAVAGCGGGTKTVEKTVTTEIVPPAQNLSLAHQTVEGLPRREPGAHGQSASGCTREVGGRVKTLHVYPDAGNCIRIRPRDRLLFVNSTGSGPDETGAREVVVTLGRYEARIEPGRSAIFAAPASSYLALGWHQVKVRGAPAPSVLVLPEGCALPDTGLGRPPLPPGEGLCFAEGAPPCDPAKLTVRTGRAGLAAGSVYQRFEVVNRSGQTCTVSGAPRVIAVDRQGRPIGPAATNEPDLTTMTGDHPKVIVLEPRGIATFQTRFGEAANFSPPCGERRSTTLRVTIPPGPPTRVPYRMERCPNGVQGFGVGRVE